MIPIDGEKLVEWITPKEMKVTCDFSPHDQIRIRIKQALINGKFNLPPGTIVIQREEGYELRPCITCIWSKFTFCDEYRCDDCPPEGVPKSKCTQHCKDCKYLPPCYEHIAPEEIEAAYIGGGGEK